MQNINAPYKAPLSSSNTLEVFFSDTMIFHDSGKWLHPLFALEDFMSKNLLQLHNIYVHDTVIGKAAAVVLIHIGIKNIHGNIVSSLALDFINNFNKVVKPENKINISWDSLVDRIMCATESELEEYSGSSISDIDYMYFLIRQRASRVLGVAVNVESVSYNFGKFHNLSFNVKAGGRLMIIGENGIGKTTLLRMIAGVYKPSTGKILIDNKDISKLQKFTIGYIPQFTDNTDYSLSVSEVVGLGICNKKNKNEIIKKSLERTSSIDLLNRNFSDLSGGEKQKVSLARCLAQNAKLLLLDEPTSSLDKENKKMVIDIVKSLSVTEIPTIIIATHDNELSSIPGWGILNLMEFL